MSFVDVMLTLQDRLAEDDNTAAVPDIVAKFEDEKCEFLGVCMV